MNIIASIILLLIILYLAYYVYTEYYEEDKDNYVSLYNELGSKGAILGKYTINYVYKPNCSHCKRFGPSFDDQMSFLNDIDAQIECNKYNLDNPYDVNRLVSQGIYDSVMRSRTVPYVSIIKNNNINTLMTLDETYRDDIYNYIYLMDNNQLDYYDQKVLGNMLNQERSFRRRFNLFNLPDYFVNYTPRYGLAGVNRWSDYYNRRRDRGRNRSRRHRYGKYGR